jgi:hypothetical protein
VDDLRRLSDPERQRIRRRGKRLLIVGLVLFVSAPVVFGLSAFLGFSSFLSGGPAAFGFLPFLAFPVAVAGLVCIFIGAVHMQFGYAKAGSEIMATETGGAVEHSSAAWSRGLGRGLKESGFSLGGAREVVKVKCRSCGYLESEDARFCSKCAKPV